MMESQASSSSAKPSFAEYLKYFENQGLKQLRKVKADMEEIERMQPELDKTKQHIESRKDRRPCRKLRPEDEELLVENDRFINGTEIAEQQIKLRCSASGLKEIMRRERRFLNPKTL